MKHATSGTILGTGTAAAERLDLWLDALEQRAHAELETAIGKEAEILTETLAKVDVARRELERCPAGAALAEAVLGASLDRMWLTSYRTKLKPLARDRAKKATAAGKRDAKIRRDAAALDGLTDGAKARFLKRKYPRLSESRLRHIIGKNKK